MASCSEEVDFKMATLVYPLLFLHVSNVPAFFADCLADSMTWLCRQTNLQPLWN